jgi:hypothetical protein
MPAMNYFDSNRTNTVIFKNINANEKKACIVDIKNNSGKNT